MRYPTLISATASLCLATAYPAAADDVHLQRERDAGAQDADEPVGALFERAVRATGKEYFAAKQEILSREDTRATLAGIVADRKLVGWRERMVATGIKQQLDEPETWDALAKQLALQAHSGSTGVSRLGLPPDLVALRSSDPKRLLDRLAGNVGLLAEVILKHSPDTMATLVAQAHAEALKQLRDELQKKPEDHPLRGWVPELRTPQQLLKKLSPKRRRSILIHGRRLAGRALVLRGDEDAVRLLEDMAKEKALRNDVAQDLEWIGTEPAIRALRRLGWSTARKAIKRLEAKKATTTKPASGKENP